MVSNLRESRRKQRQARTARVSASEAANELPFVYQTIKSQLLKRLGVRWPEGSRLPTVSELAIELEAGKTNTHRAVKELVRDGLLVSRRGRGTFVRAVAPANRKAASPGHATAANLERRLQGRRVTIIRSTVDPFVYPAVEALTEVLTLEGCSVTRAGFSPQSIPDAIAEHGQTDALALVNADVAKALNLDSRQAVVALSTAMESPLSFEMPYDSIVADSEQGGFLAGRRMREIGCKSVCFLGVYPKYLGERIDPTSAARLRGFEAGFGAPVPEENKFRAHSYQTTFGARVAARFVRLDPRPQGVFVASDDMALGFIHGALSHGLEPGIHYQIIGFDGQLRCREGGYPLTTVEVPMAFMGRTAAKMLVERMLDPTLPLRRLMVGNQMFDGVTAVARPQA